MNTEPSSPYSAFVADYRAPMPGRFTRALWWCAGADERILRFCPSSDHVKYQGIGGVVLSTGVLAFLSGSYAFHTVFGSPDVGGEVPASPVILAKSILAGLLWAAVIFNIDRFIVSSTGYGDGTDRISGQEILNALPRLAMAVIIGFCLSKPLEIRVFAAEIEADLRAQIEHETLRKFHHRQESARNESQARVADLQRQVTEAAIAVQARQAALDTATRTRNAQRDVANRERMGDPGTSGHAGIGPRFLALTAELERTQAEVAGAERALADARSAQSALEQRITTERAAFERTLSVLREEAARDARRQTAAGLLARIQAAHRVSAAGSWALTLLLLMIEMGPILFKLMVIKGTYDYLSEDLKAVIIARAGIEAEAHRHPTENAKALAQAIHHGAEKELALRRASLSEEARLGELAVRTRSSKIEEDIRAAPERFVDEVPRS